MAGNQNVSSNVGQPYYDPLRGFVYLQSNEVQSTVPVDSYDDDDQNLDEIERELYRTGSYESVTGEYAGENVAESWTTDQRIMAQMEAELMEEDKRIYTEAKNDRHILQQTWYPESRNCATCQGFKYASQFGNGQCPDCDPSKAVPPNSRHKAYVVEEG